MGLAARAMKAAHMGIINPFTGAMPLQPNRSVAERVRQSRADSKHLSDDEAAEHAVENPDAVVSIGDQESQQPRQQKQQTKEDEKDKPDNGDQPARLDVTA